MRAQGAETLVLDTRTDTAHCLPAEVARVWDACTSERSLAEVAAAAGVEDLVAAGSIDQLADLDLLETDAGPDRRRFLKRAVAIGGTLVVVPVIQSMVTPAAAAGKSKHTAAVAQSCAVQNVNFDKVTYTVTLKGYDPSTTAQVSVTYAGQTNIFTASFEVSGNWTSPSTTTGNLTRSGSTAVTITVTYTQPAGSPDTLQCDVHSLLTAASPVPVGNAYRRSAMPPGHGVFPSNSSSLSSSEGPCSRAGCSA